MMFFLLLLCVSMSLCTEMTVNSSDWMEVLHRLAILEEKDHEKNEKINRLEIENIGLKLQMSENQKQVLQLKRDMRKKDYLFKRVVKHLLMRANGEKHDEKFTNIDNNKVVDEPDNDQKADGERGKNSHDFATLNQVTAMNRPRRMENEHQVAFFAAVSPHDVTHLGAQQPIVFDNAVLNVGNAYHPYHGIFTAPQDGVYSFTATIFGRLPSGNLYFGIAKNGVSYANFEINDSHQVTQTVILDLKRGDDISVRNYNNDRGIVGHNYTTFSGFLLYENFQPQVVVG